MSSFWKLAIIITAIVAGVIAFFRSNLTFRAPVSITVDRVVETGGDSLGLHTGYKLVTIHFRMTCRKELRFPVVPECFTVVDSEGKSYRPLAGSLLFVDRGRRFSLKKGEDFTSRLTFQMPVGAKPDRLRFRKPE
ncbi:MAG TPA: hypothetical protein EYP53_04155 [Candidatus Latescibacteria bacterium]|nr:hypothetical protein [Candidatus Latescibacterota bacterium]